MNNKFINNNGVNLLNISKNKKAKVESLILLSVAADHNQITEITK
jgi:hypothetical protein